MRRKVVAITSWNATGNKNSTNAFGCAMLRCLCLAICRNGSTLKSLATCLRDVKSKVDTAAELFQKPICGLGTNAVFIGYGTPKWRVAMVVHRHVFNPAAHGSGVLPVG